MLQLAPAVRGQHAGAPGNLASETIKGQIAACSIFGAANVNTRSPWLKEGYLRVRELIGAMLQDLLQHCLLACSNPEARKLCHASS